MSEEEEEDELVNYLFEENRTLRAEVRRASGKSMTFLRSSLSQLVDYKIRLAMVAEDVRSSLFDQFDGKMREMEQEADRRVAQAVSSRFRTWTWTDKSIDRGFRVKNEQEDRYTQSSASI